MQHRLQHRNWLIGMNRGVARVAIVLAILPVVSVVGTTSVHAQTYMETVLHSFTGAPADGTGPARAAQKTVDDIDDQADEEELDYVAVAEGVSEVMEI